MNVTFSGEVWQWRGPAPFYFITVPDAEREILEDEWTFASYGWGMIPVTVRIGKTEWDTSLFPKDGSYVVPIKAMVRRRERIDEGDSPVVDLSIRTSPVRRD